jgi:hypothetical protein
MLPGTNINRNHPSEHAKPVCGVMEVVYDHKIRSVVVFLTNRFRVDAYGNLDTVDDLVYFGDMGEQQLGDMLPQDFRNQ